MMKLKVFIADDSRLIRERLVEMLLPINGIQIIGQTGDGIEAETLILKKQPDVVIMDIRMPGKNGVKVLQAIKKQKPYIKIIIITNYPFPVYKKVCMEEGADFFFDKTDGFEAITAVLDRWKYELEYISVNKKLKCLLKHACN